MLKILLVILLLPMHQFSFAQHPVLSEQTYDAGALYGYMNGGSELYNEYNFKNLTVKELNIGGQTLKFECYEMDSPISAYGIFSVNVFKSKAYDRLIIPEVSISDYQLQAVCGNHYISIINTSGDVAAQNAARDILKNFCEHNTPTDFYEVPSYVNVLNPERVFYINGQLALENRADSWLDFYKQLGIKSCYIVKLKDTSSSVMIYSTETADRHTIDPKEGYSVIQKKNIIYILKHEKNDTDAMKILDHL